MGIFIFIFKNEIVMLSLTGQEAFMRRDSMCPRRQKRKTIWTFFLIKVLIDFFLGFCLFFCFYL